jgi:hypothetical protein
MRLKRTKKNVYAYSYFSITDTLNFYKNIYISEHSILTILTSQLNSPPPRSTYPAEKPTVS